MAESIVVTRDRPLLWWLGALLFISVSSAFLYLAYAERYTLESWEAALTAVIGVLGVAAGFWFASEAPLSTVRLDRDRAELQIVRTGITGRSLECYPVAALASLTVLHRNDDDGYRVTRPALILKDGRTILLSMLWRHGDSDTSRAIEAVRIALPRLPLRMPS